MGGAHLARWPRNRAAQFATETGPDGVFSLSRRHEAESVHRSALAAGKRWPARRGAAKVTTPDMTGCFM